MTVQNDTKLKSLREDKASLELVIKNITYDISQYASCISVDSLLALSSALDSRVEELSDINAQINRIYRENDHENA